MILKENKTYVYLFLKYKLGSSRIQDAGNGGTPATA